MRNCKHFIVFDTKTWWLMLPINFRACSLRLQIQAVKHNWFLFILMCTFYDLLLTENFLSTRTKFKLAFMVPLFFFIIRFKIYYYFECKISENAPAFEGVNTSSTLLHTENFFFFNTDNYKQWFQCIHLTLF